MDNQSTAHHDEVCEYSNRFNEKMLAGLKRSEYYSYHRLQHLLNKNLWHREFCEICDWCLNELHMPIKRALQQTDNGDWLNTTAIIAIKIRWT